MSNSDNNKVYDQIMIPPLNFTNSIYYLQEVYGIYKNGLNLYCGLKNNYIMKRDRLEDPPLVKIPPNSYKNIYYNLYTQNNPDYQNYNEGTKMNNENECIEMYGFNNVMIKNDETTAKEQGEIYKILSNNEDIINFNNQEIVDNFESFNNSDKFKLGTTPKENIIWKRYNNEFIVSEREFNLKTSIIQAYKGESGFDLEMFTPNKNFILNFMDKEDKMKKYKGSYLLESCIFSFDMNKNRNFYASVGTFNFAKLQEKYIK
jgi:hypothetical protein